MYKVIDVAKMFSVSKVTIYKKITANKVELKGHITKRKNITYLDDDAVEIIKNTIQINKEKASGRLIDEELEEVYSTIHQVSDMNEELKSEKIVLLNDQITDLESTIRYLKSQLQVKGNHLKTKEEILKKFKVSIKINKDRIKVLDQILLEFKSSV